jgi:hypothetical protein
MYLWNTEALVEDLKRGPLPEAEQLKYLLFMLVTTTLSYASTGESRGPFTIVTTANVFLYPVIVAIGTIWCYRANAAGDNQQFVSRFLALIIPLGAKFVALMLLVGAVLALILGRELSTHKDAFSGWIGIAFGVLVSVMFYWRLRELIVKVSHVG